MDMLSEKHYWILLIASFTGFAGLVWFGLIPFGVIDYNLGVNLFTSSLSMILTVVFLSLLVDLREKREWKSVEKRIYEKLDWHIKSLAFEFVGLFYTYEVDLEYRKKRNLPLYSDDLMDDFTFVEYLITRKTEDLNFTHVAERYLKSEDNRLGRFCRNELGELNMIELKYHRFLDPSLLASLIDLQFALEMVISSNFRTDTKHIDPNLVEAIHLAIMHIWSIRKHVSASVEPDN